MKVYEIISESSNLSEAPLGMLGKAGAWAAGKLGSVSKAAKATKAGSNTAKATKAGKATKSLKQVAKTNPRAAKKAAEKVKSFPESVMQGLNYLVTTAFVYDYYTQLATLEEQYTKHKNGDTTTELFGDMDPETARSTAEKMRIELVGEFTVVMGASLGVASKAFGALASISSSIGGTVGKAALGNLGGKAAGYAAGSMPRLAALIAKAIEFTASNVAVKAFLLSDNGKEFIRSWYTNWITNGTGILTTAVIDLGIKALEAAGITVPDAVKTPITPSGTATSNVPTDSGKMDASTDPSLRVTTDPTNPKVKSIGDVPITGPDGYILPGMEPTVQSIKNKARVLKQPDPTSGMTAKP
jgi:hypothetical protein